MPRLATLEELAREMTEHPSLADPAFPAHLLSRPDDHLRVMGVLFEASLLYRRGEEALAFDCLLAARRLFGVLPMPVIFNVGWLCGRLGREQEAAQACRQFAESAFQEGYPDLGLEAASAAYILDARGRYELTGHPELCSKTAGWYEQAARSMPEIASCPGGDERVRVGLLSPNLTDHVVAYSKRVLHFARYADPDRYRLFVYSSENHAPRKAPLFPYGCVEEGSVVRGRALLAELAERSIPATLAPTHLRFRSAAEWLARKMAADRLDILIVQSGLSAPIDWLAVRRAPVPVKAAIHIGSSLYLHGMDVTFYANPANIERETPWWPVDGGERIVLPPGADLYELDVAPPLDRRAFGIPEQAALIGVLTNHPDRRLSEPYLHAVAEVLRRCPSAWFAVFGSGVLPDKMAVFEAMGVADRVRFAGRQTEAASALKMLDVYANEFPVGGSQSVCEAMGCRLPVAAMAAGDRHPECAGANLVGEDAGPVLRDEEAYSRRLEHWVMNPDARLQAGRAMRRKAERCGSAKGYVADLLGRVSARLEKQERADCFDCAEPVQAVR